MTAAYNTANATVKICGLKDPAVLREIADLPIDHIGFMFAGVRRKVTPAEAGSLIGVIRKEWKAEAGAPLAVGVFVDPSKEELAAVLAEAPVDVVQLHGQETPDFCRWVKETRNVRVFKSLPFAASDREVGGMTAGHAPSCVPGASAENEQTALEHKPEAARSARERLEPYTGTVDAILLDTYEPLVGGGSGRTFAWDVIPEYREAAHSLGFSLLVAGGLEPSNVKQLIDLYQPDGVDVSSGVETEGAKDPAKIRTFVERVKRS